MVGFAHIRKTTRLTLAHRRLGTSRRWDECRKPRV